MNMFHRRSGLMLALAMVAVATSCGRADAPAPLGERLRDLKADLQLGSSGEQVRAVNDYLGTFGYFPNDQLARDFPRWRPLVAEPPRDPAVFDEHTAEAIRKLQSIVDLPVTGVVDAATTDFIKSPRCGVPDGIQKLDDSDKFALFSSTWPTSPNSDTTVLWKVTNTDDGISMTSVRSAARAAFRTWSDQSSFNFLETGGTPDIKITFGTVLENDGQVSGQGGTLAYGAPPGSGSGGDITMDVAETWSLANPPAGSSNQHLQTVLLHEIGHALGLDHSADRQATMFPRIFFNSDPTVDLDDKVAISCRYDRYATLPGKAIDIGVGGDNSIWIVSQEPFGDGNRVYKWNGWDAWDPTDGGGVRIAVGPQGIPWVVTADGSIFRRTTTDPFVANAWEFKGNGGSDIGVGGTSTEEVWIVGRDRLGDGNRIYKWDNVSFWNSSSFGASKITVDTTGVPWVITTKAKFFRHSNNVAGSGTWDPLPGAASDLAVNRKNYVWSIGAVSSGQENLSLWDEQFGMSGAPTVAGVWTQGKRMGVGGPNAAVAVGTNGIPYVVDNSGFIYTSLDGAP